MNFKASDNVTRLWEIANTLPSKTGGKTGSQKSALRSLLENRGGVEFVITRPNEELQELVNRGIWAGTAILQELAGLELQRRRHMNGLYGIRLRTREILQDLGLTTQKSVPKTMRNHSS